MSLWLSSAHKIHRGSAVSIATMSFYKLSSLVAVILAVFGLVSSQRTFSNPIIDNRSADPAVLKIGNHYYLSLSTNGERQLTIYKSSRLSDFRNAETSVVYDAQEGEGDIWASEMHIVDGELYMYFSMRRGDHRVYAIKAEDPNNPFGKWGEPVNTMEDWERGGIDATIFKHGNGQQYYVWVTDGALWIARLINATTVDKSHLRLRTHTNAWECCQDEGPYFFYNNGTSYLVFSGGDTWDPNYALGYMTIMADKDPMIPSNWWFGDEKPVFYRNDEENVYGPGHCSFTYSPDGTELWMVYHAAFTPSYTDRIARIDRILFDSNGKPIFPRPSGSNHTLNVPSGEL